MINSKIFTKNEQVILGSLPSHFRWITRDEGKGGSLYVFENRPERCGTEFVCSNPLADVSGIRVFDHIFKSVTWENSPIQFRAVLLDEVEKAYLKSVLSPFQKRIAYVKKTNTECGGLQYIRVVLKNCDWMVFPVFRAGTMYKGMTVDENYSLQDLGIGYE
ncbi:MAG: hypothetical protein ACI4W2_11540 [Eubacterium sp.]